MSVTNTNPGTLFGGTWTSWGAGRVPLAIGNNGETNYTSPEQTGGSENSVATHTHEQNAHNHTQDAHHHNLRSTNSYSQDVIGYGYGAESQGVGGTKTNASVYWYEKDRSNNVLVSDSQPYIHSTTAVNKDTGVYTMSEDKVVLGANIIGNVYGGGNKANVTGNTNVNIGKATTTP